MKNQKSLPIGVFDSGLGGLTVVHELNRLLPKENLIYVGDTARVPYGTKSPDTIKRYALQIAFFLLQKKVKAIVVACNSASSVALPALKRFPVPVIGVIEPGARAAVAITRNQKVGVIGTQATMTSHAYQNAIRRHAKKAKVWEKPCPLFVPLVEEGRLNDGITKQIALEYLSPLKSQGIDALVLGCTHYPLLKNALRSVMGPGVKLIDSARETAIEVRSILWKKDLLNPSRKNGEPLFFTTDDPAAFTKLGSKFLGHSGRARHLSLENL